METSRAKQYIEKNYRDAQLTVGMIAEAVGVAPNKLSREFKRVHGCTLIRYVHRCRINRAKEMLGSTALKVSVTTVALSVGFRTATQFYRVFKRETGVSPNQWR